MISLSSNQNMFHMKFLPMGLLKPVMCKNIAKKVATGSEKEKEYIGGITECMLSLLTKKHEVYMCNLMVDLTDNWDMTSGDFQYLKGRVLLISLKMILLLMMG